MSHMCLVLNKSYIPVETISWQDAFKKIFNDLAYAIEYYDDEIVKTPTDEYLKPAVIVCTEFNGVPSRIPVYSKRWVCNRDNWQCQYCGVKVSATTFSIDHVIPRSKGGRSSFENTVCCCKPCNAKKGNKLLHTTKMKLLRKPVRPKMNPVKAKFQRMSLESEWEQYVTCHF